MKHKHKLEFEFEEGKFPRGWRGDKWCKNCDFKIYSREAMRMEMFGLGRVLNPPNKHEKDTGSADNAMFKVENLKV